MAALKIYDGSSWVTLPSGIGVPAGGSTGQVLLKASGTNYDTAWATPKGSTIASATITANVNVTATSAAAADTVIALSSATYDGDLIALTFTSPAVSPTSTSGIINIDLWEDSTILGVIGQVGNPTGSASTRLPVSITRYLTPSAGSHTYTIKAWHTSGTTGFVAANAGGSGSYNTTQLRAVKA